MKYNFNTSHVTVYRMDTITTKIGKEDFNTSHVTVYPNNLIQEGGGKLISIHPMLRFIKEEEEGEKNE